MTEKIDTKAIGDRIESMRLKRGISQTDLALMMGYKTSSTIAKWESGENIPSGIKLIELVKILNTTSDYILIGPIESKTVIHGNNNGIANLSGNVEGGLTINNHEQDEHSVAREVEIVDNSSEDLDIQKALVKQFAEQIALQKQTISLLEQILEELKK